MAERPKVPPLRPEVAPPSAQAAARAAPLFAQLLGLGSRGSHVPPSTPRAHSQPDRHYPLAARLLSEADVAPAPLPKQLTAFVRKSAPKSAVVPQTLLEDVAQMALFDDGHRGADEHGAEPSMASFVIVFREELLGELQCRIEAKPDGGVRATFTVADHDAEGVLAQHSERLRAQLQGLGLASVDVAVERGG